MTKAEGQLYTTEGIAFLKSFEFNLCNHIPGTDNFVQMTDLTTLEEVSFGGEQTMEPYLENYSANI